MRYTEEHCSTKSHVWPEIHEVSSKEGYKLRGGQNKVERLTPGVNKYAVETVRENVRQSTFEATLKFVVRLAEIYGNR